MTDVIDFFFSIMRQMWAIIVANWILSISVLIVVINSVITLVKGTSQEGK